MVLPPQFAVYRLIAEIVLVVAVTGAAAGWWHEHNQREQMIGQAECQSGVTAAREEGQKAAEAKYAAQLQGAQRVIDQYTTDKAAADKRAADADKRLSDYQNRVRASAVQAPAVGADHPGPQVVRFRLEDFQGFAGTALSVGKDGEADAAALTECKAWVDKVASAPQ